MSLMIFKFFSGVFSRIKKALSPDYNCSRRSFLQGAAAAIAITSLEIGFTNVNWSRLRGNEPQIISLVRKFYPNMLSQLIDGVQPMTSQAGQIFTIKPKYLGA